jgi:hypothetical protein
MKNQECRTRECSNELPCEWCEEHYERAFGPSWYSDWYTDWQDSMEEDSIARQEGEHDHQAP